MKFGICNEMFKDWPHERVARTVAAEGYQGVELAPFTFGSAPDKMPGDERRKLRGAFEDAGLRVIGLHWLLAGTENLSITSSDDVRLEQTAEYLRALTRLCQDLGGELMVFGSPKQRWIEPGQNPSAVLNRVVRLFQDLAPVAQEAGVTICFEPLAPPEANFITTMAEGVQLVEAVNHPAFQLHLDVKAMCAGESKPPADIIRKEGGRHLRHFHANDANLLGPGMGDVNFEPIAAALRAVGYNRWVSVETFTEGPGPEAVARQSLATITRALGEATRS